MRDMVDQGFEIMLGGCSAEGLDERWLGRYDRQSLSSIGCMTDMVSMSQAKAGNTSRWYLADLT